MMARRVSIVEAARLTGLSVTTLRRGYRSGRFPAVRAGEGLGKFLFDVSQIERALRFEEETAQRVPPMVEYENADGFGDESRMTGCIFPNCPHDHDEPCVRPWRIIKSATEQICPARLGEE